MSNKAKGIFRRSFLKVASATLSTASIFKGWWRLFAEEPSRQGAPGHGADPWARNRPRINLDGVWAFQLDPNEQGESLGWHQASAHFERKLKVPGAWEAQGLGLPQGQTVGERTYEGRAWLRRGFALPADWRGKRIWLSVGGVHRRATFWLNGHEVGFHDGYSTPFTFDLTEWVSFGGENSLTVCVDNIYRGGDDDQFGCFDWIYNWGGIHRSVHLEATEPIWIDDVFVVPDLAGGRARVKLQLANKMGTHPALLLRVECVISTATPPEREMGRGEVVPAFPAGGTAVEFELPVPLKEVRPWSPTDPFLYRVQVSLFCGARRLDERWERFGMREIKVEQRNILLNGNPLYLLGYGDDCIFPLTVSPSLDREEYRHRLGMARKYGFNYVRHHTHVPIEEYLEVADELGMMVQIELPIWGSYSDDATMGTEYRKNLLEAEWRRMILHNRNHPCVVTYSMGNENYSIHPDVRAFLARLYNISKELDPTRLVLNQAGSTPSQDPSGHTDFIERSFGERFESPEGEIRENLHKKSKDLTRPVIVHEMGYFSSFPDSALIPKYESVKVLPAYYAAHLLVQANAAMKNQLNVNPYAGKFLSYVEELPLWASNSARLQAANLKLAIEEIRKVPTVNGYSLWLLTDTGALVHGLLDDFWQPKVVSATEFRKYNSESVMLLGSTERTAWMGEELEISLLISHFHNQPLKFGRLEWAFALEGKSLLAGSAENLSAVVGQVTMLATVRATVPRLPKAATLTFTVTLKSQLPEITNQWKFWVFPKELVAATDQHVAVQARLAPIVRRYPFFERLFQCPGIDVASIQGKIGPETFDQLNANPPALLITSSLPSPGLAYLQNGGRIFLLSDGLFEELETEYRTCYINAAGNNLGTVIRRHPALDAFPHEGFCDLQFYRMLKVHDGRGGVRDGKTIVLEDVPVTLDPIIRSIDRYQYLRDKAYLFEVGVGRGKLLVSTLNFFPTIGLSSLSQPAVHEEVAKADFLGPECLFLFDQLVRYALSEEFRPSTRISTAALAKLMQPHMRHHKPDDLLDCAFCPP